MDRIDGFRVHGHARSVGSLRLMLHGECYSASALARLAKGQPPPVAPLKTEHIALIPCALSRTAA